MREPWRATGGRLGRPRQRGGPACAAAVAAWLAAILTATLAAAPGDAPAAGPADDDPLPALLERMSRAALLYADTALQFTCEEALEQRPGRSYRFDYIYVHGPDGTLRDYRTRHGDRRGREVRPDTIRLHAWLTRVYSWVFLFDPERRERMHYRFAGDGEALGRPAVLVAFAPEPPIEKDINDWYGTAWVDSPTGQVLRVEALSPASFTARADLDAALAAPVPPHGRPRESRWRIASISAEFGYEQNGIRFPTRATIEVRDHILPRGRGGLKTATSFTIVQTYRRYRFFGVEAGDPRLHARDTPPR